MLSCQSLEGKLKTIALWKNIEKQNVLTNVLQHLTMLKRFAPFSRKGELLVLSFFFFSQVAYSFSSGFLKLDLELRDLFRHPGCVSCPTSSRDAFQQNIFLRVHDQFNIFPLLFLIFLPLPLIFYYSRFNYHRNEKILQKFYSDIFSICFKINQNLQQF